VEEERGNEYYAWKREEISSRPSFNIRFIFISRGRSDQRQQIPRLASRSFLVCRSTKDRGDGWDEAGGARLSSQFPKQGLCSTRGKLNFRTPCARREFIYRMDQTKRIRDIVPIDMSFNGEFFI